MDEVAKGWRVEWWRGEGGVKWWRGEGGVEWWRGEGGWNGGEGKEVVGGGIEGQRKKIVGIMTLSNSFNNCSCAAVGNI